MSSLPITNPTWIFFVVLSIILFAPMLLNRLRIPNLIGMILAGALIGEHGLNLLQRDASFELFGKVGIYFIMFLAGLEMDMQNLKQNRNRGLIFGVITTLVPFTFGLLTGVYVLHYSWQASVLLSCILASHTLVSYPIVSRYGLSRNPVVSISIVATMIALLTALFILACLSGVVRGSTDIMFWVMFAGKLVLFAAFIFLLVPHIVKMFFRRITEPIMQFSYTLVVVFLSAAVAEACGLEGILGAFLAGLVLNRFVPGTSPLMNRLEFVGNALFVPYFLIGVGMMVNIHPLLDDWHAVMVVVIMVIAGTISKLIAAHISRRMFGFNKAQGRMMFGLTEAHAAGALAMVIVGTQLEIAPGVPLMDNTVLDGVVIMILLSCVIASVATDQAARQLKIDADSGKLTSNTRRDGTALDDEKILIPVNDPNKIDALLHTAFMMRNARLKRGLICLNIINDSDTSAQTQSNNKECLRRAHQVASAADIPMQAQTRLAVNFVTAAIHSMRENDASEMLVGLHRQRKPNDSFYGQFCRGLIDGMMRQLMIVNLHVPTNILHHMIVAVPPQAEYEKGFYRWINRIARIAADLGCTIEFHSTEATAQLAMNYIAVRHKHVQCMHKMLSSFDELHSLSNSITQNTLFVVVTARRGSVSFNKRQTFLPQILQKHFADANLLIVFPDQQEDAGYGPL